MKPTRKQRTGDLGETAVNLALQKIGWAPALKLPQDIGDDLITFARDMNGEDLGLPVLIQVKSSEDEYAKVSKRKGPAGWWYTDDSDLRHFDHWVRHGLPYLLALYDVKSGTCYWAHVTEARLSPAARGARSSSRRRNGLIWSVLSD